MSPKGAGANSRATRNDWRKLGKSKGKESRGEMVENVQYKHVRDLERRGRILTWGAFWESRSLGQSRQRSSCGEVEGARGRGSAQASAFSPTSIQPKWNKGSSHSLAGSSESLRAYKPGSSSEI